MSGPVDPLSPHAGAPTEVLWLSLGSAFSPSGFAPLAPTGADAERVPPAIPGLRWRVCTSLSEATECLALEGHLAAVLLRVADPALALRLLELDGQGPLRRRAVLVWPEHDDPTLDDALYGAGAQDVLDDADVRADVLPRRVAAAIARKRTEAAAHRAFATDPHTGLVNRQQLVEHLSHLLAVRAREASPAPVGVVLVEVGPPEGFDGSLSPEELLQLLRRKVAVRLRGAVRASDVVAALDAQRYAVMLSAVEVPADVASVAAKLAGVVRQPLALAGRAVRVAVSTGHAVAPDDGDQPEPLLHRAGQRALGASASAAGRGPAANDA